MVIATTADETTDPASRGELVSMQARFFRSGRAASSNVLEVTAQPLLRTLVTRLAVSQEK
jgi:hypothetical protein